MLEQEYECIMKLGSDQPRNRLIFDVKWSSLKVKKWRETRSFYSFSNSAGPDSFYAWKSLKSDEKWLTRDVTDPYFSLLFQEKVVNLEWILDFWNLTIQYVSTTPRLVFIVICEFPNFSSTPKTCRAKTRAMSERVLNKLLGDCSLFQSSNLLEFHFEIACNLLTDESMDRDGHDCWSSI